MTEATEHDDDEYLWTGSGAGSLELRALERELRPLAWAPRELPLPGCVAPVAPSPHSVQAISSAHGQDAKRRRSPSGSASGPANWPAIWPPILAGFAAAAAVLVAVVWLRGSSDVGRGEPELEDQLGRGAAAAAPPSGTSGAALVDPFAQDSQPGTSAPQAPALVDPFARDRAPELRENNQPALVDPFVGTTPSAPPTPPKNAKPKSSPNLEDPFAHEGDRPSPAPPRANKPAKLVDPFAGSGSSATHSEEHGPDLKDPFQH